MGLALPGDGVGMRAAHVADVAAAIDLGVGVEDLLVKSFAGHSEAVAFADNRRGIDDEDQRGAGARLAHERGDAVVGVVEIDPFESRRAQGNQAATNRG